MFVFNSLLDNQDRPTVNALLEVFSRLRDRGYGNVPVFMEEFGYPLSIRMDGTELMLSPEGVTDITDVSK